MPNLFLEHGFDNNPSINDMSKIAKSTLIKN